MNREARGPLWLALESSTPVASVALGRANVLLGELLLGAEIRHAEALLPAIDQLLRLTGCPRTELAAIVVGGGPGSFTGLRIAAATAKGLVHALELPLFAYSGLLVVTATTGILGRPVCSMFDARRGEVYAASYVVTDRTIDVVLSPAVLELNQLLEMVPPASTAFAGEGAVKHADEIRRRGGEVLPAHAGIPRASSLLWLAHDHGALGRVADPAHWQPEYLRASSAERGISA
ncbi:MAG TPA: tRNA (adenosine(37)-N6)-threonylcarbamoyltransferase complex dimerization subunit type 1 TsaB [Longimicrobiales bacterium]|nr:tRNA (adenosine(37)-N6)-threonylcarbamoyltransferase complex dimerization subunit type 1 TsaB [Longimicrobiales bacterium]